jgi:hypothetical protein
MKKVAVEKGLSMVADYLTSQGFSVELISEDLASNAAKFNGFDAIVTADYNTNFMGFSDTATEIPVINASGLTAEEIKNMINQQTNK